MSTALSPIGFEITRTSARIAALTARAAAGAWGTGRALDSDDAGAAGARCTLAVVVVADVDAVAGAEDALAVVVGAAAVAVVCAAGALAVVDEAGSADPAVAAVVDEAGWDWSVLAVVDVVSDVSVVACASVDCPSVLSDSLAVSDAEASTCSPASGSALVDSVSPGAELPASGIGNGGRDFVSATSSGGAASPGAAFATRAEKPGRTNSIALRSLLLTWTRPSVTSMRARSSATEMTKLVPFTTAARYGVSTWK